MSKSFKKVTKVTTLGMLDTKGPKAPSIPNYSKLATRQANDQQKIAEYLTGANRPNQVDAMGNSVTWSKDPATGQWTQKQNWNQDVKGQYKGQIANANKANDLYKTQLGKLEGQKDFKSPTMPTYDEASGKAVSDATYNAMTARTRPEQGRQQTELSNQLRLQGLQPGTEAFDRAMRNMYTSHADADYLASQNATISGYDEARQRYLAQLQGQGQEFGQKLTEHQLPWQQAQIAQGLASDRYMPQMPGFSGATGYNPADQIGAANAKYQAQMGQYNAQNQKKGQTLGAGASLGSAAIMASDEELKDNITKLDGEESLRKLLEIGGYSWTWKDNGLPDVGVIAQNVQKVMSNLINTEEPYLRVNYTGLVGMCIAALGYLAEVSNADV